MNYYQWTINKEEVWVLWNLLLLVLWNEDSQFFLSEKWYLLKCITQNTKSFKLGLEYADCITCRGFRHLPKKGVLDMKINGVWWWGSSSWDQGRVKLPVYCYKVLKLSLLSVIVRINGNRIVRSELSAPNSTLNKAQVIYPYFLLHSCK